MVPAPARVCLVGASDDTGNLGVSALMHAVVTGLATREPDARLTVFDHGRGVRADAMVVAGRDAPYRFQRLGMWRSRRFHRPESLWNLRVSARLGGLGNRGARALLAADAVWDLSGGDSFGDLYGQARWTLITRPKRLVLAAEGRLMLLPQTYGPYRSRDHREIAARIVRGAAMAWARDPDSYAVLEDLLGSDLDERRHRLGVDVAFGLDARAPGGRPRDLCQAWLEESGSRPRVGLNVSGLCYNDPDARERYGLRTDYRRAVMQLLRQLLDDTDSRIMLVPHVRGRGAESDDRACADIVAGLPPSRRDDVTIAPEGLGPSETKWLIGQLDWFCGTRMHATIAALSSGVPATAVAYSLKTRGVFATCGLADQVVDARSETTEDATAALIRGFRRRAEVRARLDAQLPDVLARARHQLDEIVHASGRRAPGRPVGVVSGRGRG